MKRLPHFNSAETLIEHLEQLVVLLSDVQRKETIIDSDPSVKAFLGSDSTLNKIYRLLNPAEQYLVKCVVSIGQDTVLFQGLHPTSNPHEKLKELFNLLQSLEQFYGHIGGIIGYHLTFLKLVHAQKLGCSKDNVITYEKPIGIDLTHDDQMVKQAARWGIECLPEMAEIYPVGGAGERLKLHDPVTGEPLPAAELTFCGRSLLEGLIRDLQAREYLYEKLTGLKVIVPIAMMTSQEKNNHERILNICEKSHWFGRPKDSFRFFMQPLVPVISEDGHWCMHEAFKPILKPGGHGVMWKLAVDQGIFSWFKSLGRKKALVRQINNPIAGTDDGLTAFTGIGCKKDKAFGFASCFRLLNAAEGVNVMLKKEVPVGYSYCITNIEYSDFSVCGISEEPMSPGSPYSTFPANTNILFADLATIEQTIKTCPIPGLLVNMKTKQECLDEKGVMYHVTAGRLESTMQNIADYIVDTFPEELNERDTDRLRTFVTYNHRYKTISVTKKSHTPGHSLLETPEGCFFDMVKNHYNLLKANCKMVLPEWNQNNPIVFLFHPALGPLYHVIGQKLQGGTLASGACLIVEIANLYVKHLTLDGALSVIANDVLDRDNGGKCTLEGVRVENKGVNWSRHTSHWECAFSYDEVLEIVIEGNGEFYAKDVVFRGTAKIEVPSGYLVEAKMNGDEVVYKRTKIEKPTWNWKYEFNSDGSVLVHRR